MVGGGQCSSVIAVILTLLGDDRGAPSGWRIIHSNNNNNSQDRNNSLPHRPCGLSSQLVPKLTRTLVSSYLLLVNSYLIFGQLVPVLVNSYLFWLTRPYFWSTRTCFGQLVPILVNSYLFLVTYFWLTRTYFWLTRTLVKSYLSQLVPM